MEVEWYFGCGLSLFPQDGVARVSDPGFRLRGHLQMPSSLIPNVLITQDVDDY